MAKILIVDDLATERAVMQSVVSGLGHQSVVASDGEEAINMIASENPDLVLLDIVLPKADGFKVCRKIKKDPNTAHIPVILLSTKDQESDRFWGMKQGANEYFVKPYPPNELENTIKQLLS